MWHLFFPIDRKGRVSPRTLTSLYAQQQAIGAMSLGPVDSPSRALLHQIARQIPVVSSVPQQTKLESSDLPKGKAESGPIRVMRQQYDTVNRLIYWYHDRVQNSIIPIFCCVETCNTAVYDKISRVLLHQNAVSYSWCPRL